MDIEETKIILANYTLNTDSKDEIFQEALTVAKANPELMQWWTEAKAFDTEAKKSMDQIPVPGDLAVSLKASIGALESSKPKQKRTLAFWVSRCSAIAACLLLSFLVYDKLIVDRSDEYEGPLLDRAFQYSYDGPRLSYFNKDTEKLRNWLVDNEFDLPDALPPKLLEQKGIGCRPLNWSEDRVALMCFDAHTVYHLFMTKEGQFEGVDATPEIAYQSQKKGWTLSKWKSNGYVFVLSAKADEQQMGAMLAGYTPEAIDVQF
ncbi:hypothetical protein MLD52_12665 [Puniceicoccaceae bacterium K14]|nr:hypothetical protein [Puniceicoccaceae bacterium K14]